MKKLRFLVVTVCIILSFNLLAVSASAVETVDGFPFVDDEANYFDSYPRSATPRVIGLENQLFTMSASSLTKLLTTDGTNKTFYGSRFSDNGDVYYCGKVTTYYSHDASAGICTWNPATSSYEAKHRTYFSSKEFTCSEMIPTTEFRDETRYFGFINGTDTGGTTGDIQFWYLNYDA